MSAGAVAAPLCKDLKGLFTPCPKELNERAARRLRESRAAAEATGGAASAPGAEATAADTPAKRAHMAPLFAAGVSVSDSGKLHRAKLCHDLKGLYTPCPR